MNTHVLTNPAVRAAVARRTHLATNDLRPSKASPIMGWKWGEFHSDQWGDFRTYFKFHPSPSGKIKRLDIGQAA